MAEDRTLEELEAAVEAILEDFRTAETSEERENASVVRQELRDAINAKKHELYFSLETPEPLGEIEDLSVEELKELLKLLRAKASVLHQFSPESEEKDAAEDRSYILRAQQEKVQVELDRKLALSYDPGPEDAPGYEPAGYTATKGFVKLNPENNDFYVAQFENDPWYPAISNAHSQLSNLIPGYNITQIKEKFGGLRYYFSYPDPIPVREDWPAYSTPEKIRAMADRIVTHAEGWVEGYSHAQREKSSAEIATEGLEDD